MEGLVGGNQEDRRQQSRFPRLYVGVGGVSSTLEGMGNACTGEVEEEYTGAVEE